MSLLSVKDLSVGIRQQDQVLSILDQVSFNVERGQTFGVVGESGCGKSLLALTLMGLLPKPYGQVLGGSIVFEGEDLCALPRYGWRSYRGRKIAMIFQEPMSALNPLHKIGQQICEMFRLHQPELSRNAQRKEAVVLLRQVGIPDPEQRLRQYPHELSGGMRQRVMIAIALSCKPDLLIADEPTTALDVTVQRQILELIRTLQKSHNMAVILITHNMGVVANYCDSVSVMYAGRFVEQGSVAQIFEQPTHPYTQDLLGSVPKLSSIRQSPLAAIEGRVPSFQKMVTGCRYHTRCGHAVAECRAIGPQLETVVKEHSTACWRWQEIHK